MLDEQLYNYCVNGRLPLSNAFLTKGYSKLIFHKLLGLNEFRLRDENVQNNPPISRASITLDKI